MVGVVSRVSQYLSEIKKNDHSGKKINAFLALNPRVETEAKHIDAKIKAGTAGKLAGTIFSIKSNICVAGLPTTCASETLKDFIAPYDATVIKKIKEADGLIIGMTNMDEFACGGSGETSAFGATKNPRALDRIPGGSSSGSAASVAAGFCDISLGSDTGGSVRNPASHCGVVGLKPSYGAVSRYGLIDLSMSLDQVGVLGTSVFDVAKTFSVIYGSDPMDAMSKDSSFHLEQIAKPLKKIRVGVLDLPGVNLEISKRITEFSTAVAQKFGWSIQFVTIPHIALAIETYYPLVYVEFFSGTRKFDGRRFGSIIEDTCGAEVLRRILGGSEISKAEYGGRYYERARAIRDLIATEISKVFKNVDCIISPTVPKLPHRFTDKLSVEEMYQYDALTIPANLAGNCAISIPAGKIQNIPLGLHIMCDRMQEELLLQIAHHFEASGVLQ